MEIPVYAGSAMVYVDQSQFTVRWNETIALEVVGKTWTYYGFEKTDDGWWGYDATALFSSIGVSNNNIAISSDQNWMKTIIKQEIWPNWSAKVACWSTKCPDFVHFNPQNFTFWTLADETYGKPVNGTYIYMVWLTKLSDGVVSSSTYTIKMAKAPLN